MMSGESCLVGQSAETAASSLAFSSTTRNCTLEITATLTGELNDEQSPAHPAAMEDKQTTKTEPETKLKQCASSGVSRAPGAINPGQQDSGGCSSAADVRSCSANSTTTTASSASSSSTTSTTSSAATIATTTGRSRAGSSTTTTSMSKFKEKRPEPLKLNQASTTGNNQDIPLDLSVKSAGFVPSGFLGSLFNNLTCTTAANSISGGCANNNSNHMTTLETPRIVWQDNDALLVKQRLFSSSTSANSQRMRLCSLAGDSPPITPGTPGTVPPSPSSSMVLGSPVGRTTPAAGQQLNQRRHQQQQHNFLSPLFGHHHLGLRVQQQQHHFPPSKPLSAGYVLSRNSSQSLQSALMSAHLHYNRQQQQQASSGAPHFPVSASHHEHYHQAMLKAATKLSSPFNQLDLQVSAPAALEAYLRAPRRSCSTENLTGRNPLLGSALSSASDHHNQQHHNFLHHQHNNRAGGQATIEPNNNLFSNHHQQQQQQRANNRERISQTADLSNQKHEQQNNRFSYSGQQIAAAAAELGKSQSPIINVIEGSSCSSNEDTRDSNSNGATKQSCSPGSGTKALTPTSVAKATANLLNIRLSSPSGTGQQQQQPQNVDHHDDGDGKPIDDPLIWAAICREQPAWSSANNVRQSPSSSSAAATATATIVTTTPSMGSSMSSISTTLNTPTLISPSHFKGSSICFLPSPTLSPMSSVFELPSPLLMFPPPPATVATPSSPSCPTSANSRLQATNQAQSQNHNQAKVGPDPAAQVTGGHELVPSPCGLGVSQLNATRGEPEDTPRAGNELALAESTPMQVDQNQDELQRPSGSPSEQNLAQLVTCARDKTGQSDDNDDYGDDNDYNDNDNDDDNNDLANHDESMEIDLQRRPHQTMSCRQQVARPATVIPRILVSDCLLMNQQQQQPNENANVWPPAAQPEMLAGHQDRFQRQPVPKRALSPQSLRAHISIYHRQRLESSSAPPDGYQGKARPKLKCITGGSAIDFHHHHHHLGHPCLQHQSAQLVGSFANRQPDQQQQQQQQSSDNQCHQCKPCAGLASSSGHLNWPAPGGQSALPGQALPADRRQLSACRPSSADPSPLYQSRQQPVGEYLPPAIGSNQEHQQQQHYPGVAANPMGGAFSHSAQHLQAYAGAGAHVDPFLQSVSAGELSGPAQIHQSGHSSAEPNQRSGCSSMFLQQTSAAASTTGQSQLLLTSGHHHNQPFQQQQGHQSRRADGMSDHSLSMGELHSTRLQSRAPNVANQSPGPAMISQPQQRAASAYSLSLVASSQHPARQQQQQLESLPSGSSFRSQSAASSFGPTNQQQQQQQSLIEAAANVKKYRCDECSKAFTRSDMLTRHKRLHSGDRPFQCNECKQEFSRSDHLSTHMRTHTGEKPYRCKLCSYSACRKDMITRHMKVHNRSSPSSASAHHQSAAALAHHPNSDSLSSSSSLSLSSQQQQQQLARCGDLSGRHSLAHR